MHVVGLDYNMDITAWQLPCQTLKFGAEAVYNDGAAALAGLDLDRGWSYAKFSLASPMAFAGGTLTPSIAYQKGLEDSLNDYNQDTEEVVGMLSYQIGF